MCRARHLAASEYLEFLPDNCQFFTWLRQPLQRICSHYYYWKNNRLEPRLSPEAKPLFDGVVSGSCSLLEFGRHPLIAEYCSTMLNPLGLDGLALAAVVEYPTLACTAICAFRIGIAFGMRVVTRRAGSLLGLRVTWTKSRNFSLPTRQTWSCIIEL